MLFKSVWVNVLFGLSGNAPYNKHANIQVHYSLQTMYVVWKQPTAKEGTCHRSNVNNIWFRFKPRAATTQRLWASKAPIQQAPAPTAPLVDRMNSEDTNRTLRPPKAEATKTP